VGIGGKESDISLMDKAIGLGLDFFFLNLGEVDQGLPKYAKLLGK
jgi:hypothetical protein